MGGLVDCARAVVTGLAVDAVGVGAVDAGVTGLSLGVSVSKKGTWVNNQTLSGAKSLRGSRNKSA